MEDLYTVTELLDETIRLWKIRAFAQGTKDSMRRKVDNICRSKYNKSDNRKKTEKRGPDSFFYCIPDIMEFVFGDMFDYVKTHSSLNDFTVNTKLFNMKVKTIEEVKHELDYLEEPITPDDLKAQMAQNFIDAEVKKRFEQKKQEIMLEAIFKKMNLELNTDLLEKDIRHIVQTTKYQDGMYEWTKNDHISWDRIANYENYYSVIDE